MQGELGKKLMVRVFLVEKGKWLVSSKTLTDGGVATFKRGGTPMGRDGMRLVRS